MKNKNMKTKKTKHDTFKYFVTCNADGGCEQETGYSVKAFDSLDQAINSISDPLEYVFGGDADSEIEEIKLFKPGKKPAEVYSFTLENGGDRDDWLCEDYTIVYTNVWSERIEYDI